jgi:hypothetical protein
MDIFVSFKNFVTYIETLNFEEGNFEFTGEWNNQQSSILNM